MSKEIKISDWVTEEEFNYSPTGELSAVLYLAEQRSEWFAKGEKAAEVRILDMLRRWDSFTNDVNQFQDEMRRACDIGYEYGEEAREEAMKAFIESGMELRRDDIELGRKLERERIIKLLEDECSSD